MAAEVTSAAQPAGLPNALARGALRLIGIRHLETLGSEEGLVFACLYLGLMIPLEAAAWGFGAYRALLLLGYLALLLAVAFAPKRLHAAPAFRALRAGVVIVALIPAAAALLSIGTRYQVRVMEGLIVAGVILVLWSQAQFARLRNPGTVAIFAVLILGACALIPLAHLVSGLVVPKLVDIATTTAAAARAIWAGQNPYTIPLDPNGLELMHDAHFTGYKYPPLMAIVYLPFVLAFGDFGVVIENACLYVALCVTVFSLAKRLSSASPLLAVILVLASPTAAEDPLGIGGTDIACLLPLTLAFLAWGKRPALTGLLIGLSLCMKPLPGVFAATLFLPEDRRAWPRYVAGIVLGLAPAIYYFALAPQAFLDNVVLFSFGRPVDSTSWRWHQPEWIGKPAQIAALLVWMASTAWCTITRAPLAARLCAYVAVVLCVLLSAPAVHDNYLMWWIPVFAALIAAMGTRRSDFGTPA